jgi:hypothetical protein
VPGLRATDVFPWDLRISIEEVFMKLILRKKYEPIHLVLAVAVFCAVVVSPPFVQDDDLKGSEPLSWDAAFQSFALETTSAQDVEYYKVSVCYRSFSEFDSAVAEPLDLATTNLENERV